MIYMPLLKKAKPLLDEMSTGKNVDINDIFTDEMIAISHEMIVGIDDKTFEKSKIRESFSYSLLKKNKQFLS